MKRCSAITQAGAACQGKPVPGDDKCYMHSATTLEQRRRTASKGGKRGGRGRSAPVSYELARLQEIFETLAERIEKGEIERGTAAVMIQAYNGARSCAAAILKARELEELEARIVELEERQHSSKFGGF